MLEGPEGAGKSTQARLLAERLADDGWRVRLTREPGGTAIGEAIRRILLAADAYAMLAETETLLYSAARAQHVGDVVRPALSQGMIVVCDRFVDSTLAYQGGGRGLPTDLLGAIQRLATGGLRPDLRLLLDVPVDVGLARRFAEAGTVNRIDAADSTFHERVRQAYVELVAAEPEGWAVIEGAASIESVAADVHSVVRARLGDRLDALRRQPSGSVVGEQP